MEHLFKSLVEQWISLDLLENEQKNKVLDVLMKKRNFVDETTESMAKQFSALTKKFDRSSTKSSKLEKRNSTAQGIGSAMMFSAMTTAMQVGDALHLPPSLLKDIYPIMECLPDDAEG